MAKKKGGESDIESIPSDKEETKSNLKNKKKGLINKVKKSKQIESSEGDVTISRSVKVPLKILTKKKLRICFQCKKKTSKGSSVQWHAPELKVYDVWLCDSLKCDFNFWRGYGWHSKGRHEFHLCHQCNNIVFKYDIINEIPCLCCKLNPRTIYKTESNEENGLKRILKFRNKSLVEDSKLKYSNVTVV